MASGWRVGASFLVVLLAGTACTTTAPAHRPTASSPTSSTTPTSSTAQRVRPLPVGAGVDYQLGGASPVPAGVGVVVRDRTDPPAGDYAVCYVNGFQTQPDAHDAWLRDHPDLVLRDAAGQPVADEDWGELLLDTRRAVRERLVAVLTPWLTGCAEDGYDAVELDNLDSWTRSDGLLTDDDAVATLAALADVAHRAGLAVGQKNAVELVPRLAGTVADFAVVEECGRYDECAGYADAYDDRVLVIEYTAGGLAAACRGWARVRPVLRDLDLVPAGRTGHLRREC